MFVQSTGLQRAAAAWPRPTINTVLLPLSCRTSAPEVSGCIGHPERLRRTLSCPVPPSHNQKSRAPPGGEGLLQQPFFDAIPR